MNDITPHPPKFHPGALFWIGIGLFTLGTGPLLLIILFAEMGFGDPNTRAIGPGILAMFTLYPSLIIIFGGLIEAFFKHRAAKKRFHNHEA